MGVSLLPGKTEASFSNYVDPRVFGAVGDGVADDTTAVLAAMVYARTSGIKRVRFSGKFKISEPVLVDSGMEIFGDGFTLSEIIQSTANKPVIASRNYYSAEGAAISGRVRIHDLQITGGSAAGANNHGILLRDYYTLISNTRITNAGGNGIHITHTNDVGAESGTLVENRIENVTVRTPTGYCIYAGADDNNKITDGFLINCLLHSSATTPNHLRIGSGAGWTINGLHTYGTSPTSHSVNLLNAYHTNVDNVYIECFGATAHAISAGRTQRALAFSNITVKNNTANAAAIRIDKSSSNTSPCHVSISGLHVHNTSANTVYAISTLSEQIVLEIAGMSIHNAGAGKIIRYLGDASITYIDGMMKRTANGYGLVYDDMGLAYSKKSNFDRNDPAIAISKNFTIKTIGNYSSISGTVFVNSREFHNQAVRTKYMGMVYIQAKLNGSDAWVVSMTDIIAPVGFTSAPAATVADNGDGTGTLTITFTPNDTDGYGHVGLLLTPGETA